MEYTLNTTVTASGKLFMFLKEDWLEITPETDCTSKFEQARASCEYLFKTYHSDYLKMLWNCTKLLENAKHGQLLLI